MYVVTARHVLFKEIDGVYSLYDNSATIRAPDFQGGENQPAIFDNLLNEANTCYNEEFDVALIHLGTYRLTNNNKALHPAYREETQQTQLPTTRAQFYGEHSKRALDQVSVGTDVFIAGYPTSLGIREYIDFFDTDRPVIRKGIVSHINYKKQHIIIDCFVFAGNSGGPVFQSIDQPDARESLIGLVSKYVPYRQTYVIPNENIRQVNYINSGYTVVVSMDHVIKTILEFSQKLPDPYEGREPGWNDEHLF
jgi:hypothetical protein